MEYYTLIAFLEIQIKVVLSGNKSSVYYTLISIEKKQPLG